MKFVNEYVAPDDVHAYGLDALWDKFHPSLKGRRLPGFQYAWTVDREHGVFLMRMTTGKEEYSNQVTFYLSLQGVPVLVVVSKDATKDGCIWNLVNMELPSGSDLSRETVLDVLRDALKVYGYRGAYQQEPNYQVHFTFC